MLYRVHKRWNLDKKSGYLYLEILMIQPNTLFDTSLKLFLTFLATLFLKDRVSFFPFPHFQAINKCIIGKEFMKMKRKINFILNLSTLSVSLTMSKILTFEKTQNSFGFLLTYPYLCTQYD